MPSKNNIDFQVSGIASTIKMGGLTVPKYQRSYAWEEKHINDLLTDFGTAIKEKRDEYFLGSIVLLEEKDTLQVVDGQQRLATCSILIAAIRDFLFEENDSERADDIEKEYLISKERRSQEYRAKLKLNSTDHDFFQKYVLVYSAQNEKRKIKPSHESHKKIKKAAQLTRVFVKNLTSVVRDPNDQLIDWLDYLDDSIKIIRVKVPDGVNAFTIFETLNDRGLDLAISDLLKNYLFDKAGDRISEAQENWTKMIGALAAVDAEKYNVTFIRHIWSTQHGLTRERELYQKIKDHIKSKQSAIDFSKILADGSLLYAAILNPNSEIWKEYGETTRRHMKTLNLLRMTQVRPLIVSVLSKFGKKDVAKTMRLLVAWAVRFYILGKLGSGELEKFYSSIAKDVSTGNISSYPALRKTAQKEVPTDSQFENAFSNATVGRSYLSRYYLLALENGQSGSDDAELIPNDNPDAVNLEHILPSKPNSDWEIEDHYLETHCNRIGNLVLLKAKDNSLAGNMSFKKKKGIYAKSKFELTKIVSTYPDWDATSIETRQKDLAKLAVRVWSI